MKVAVCLSGQSRTYKHTASNILGFFSNPGVEVDYYIHVWNVNRYSVGRGLKEQREDVEKLREQLQECYHTDNVIVDEEIYKFSGVSSGISLSRSIRMIPDTKQYDWVFWTRLDLIRVMGKEPGTPNYGRIQQILSDPEKNLLEDPNLRMGPRIERTIFLDSLPKPRERGDGLILCRDIEMSGALRPMKVLGGLEKFIQDKRETLAGPIWQAPLEYILPGFFWEKGIGLVEEYLFEQSQKQEYIMVRPYGMDDPICDIKEE